MARKGNRNFKWLWLSLEVTVLALVVAGLFYSIGYRKALNLTPHTQEIVEATTQVPLERLTDKLITKPTPPEPKSDEKE